MAGPLQRAELITGLKELIERIHQQGLSDVSIRIIGGAAIQLSHFERATTADIDAQIKPAAEVMAIAEAIGRERGWPIDWLNDEAAMFIPRLGPTVDWQTIFEDEEVSISVAPIDALLAMKLLAARPGRDTGDIARLLALNRVVSTSEAEEMFEAFYPGDALGERTIQLLDRIFELGLPELPQQPAPPDLR